MTRPTAIGYLRRDVSGTQQPWDETQIRSLAARLGYTLTRTVAFSNHTSMPIAQLRAVVDRFEANAIFTPSLEHFEDQEPPAELIAVADVITVHDGHTYAQLNTSI